MQEEKAKQVWMCTFCGAPHETKEQAEQCWESHTELTIDYIYGGIGSDEMPVECIIKKHERGYVTKIATYVLKEVEEVKMRERKIVKKE